MYFEYRHPQHNAMPIRTLGYYPLLTSPIAILSHVIKLSRRCPTVLISFNKISVGQWLRSQARSISDSSDRIKSGLAAADTTFVGEGLADST